MGGGIGLLAGASHRVVTPDPLAMPEITIGLCRTSAAAGSCSVCRDGPGLFLALTGAPLDASDALFAGLADFALAADGLPALLDDIVAADWQGEQQADAARLDHLLARHAAGTAGLAAAVAPAAHQRS